MPDKAAPLGGRVLLVAPYGQDASSLLNLLSRNGFQVTAFPTLDDAAGRLDETVGAVLMTQEALRLPLQAFAGGLASQPDWSDIPLVLLTARQTHATAAFVVEALPLQATNVVMLEKPLGASSLTTALDSALRSRQRQFVLRDRLSELEAGRASLASSERELRSIADAQPTLIGLVDRDGRYLFANRAYEQWLGLTAEQVVGRPVAELLDPAEYAVRKPYMERALAGESVTLERSWPHLDGRRRDAEIRYIPRRDADGRIDAFHVFVVDITDRKRNAEELEREVRQRTEELNQENANRLRAEEALRQSQKMEAVGQLTGGVAHDFNNLLTIIRSSVDYLAKDGLTEERRRRYVQAISETTARAAKLTGQLLAFARRQPLTPEVFDVSERVTGVAELVRPLVGGRVEIRTEVQAPGDTPLCVEADVSQFETALVNLAVNARDAMDGEGVLRLSVTAATALPPLRGHSGARGDFVVIAVADNGCGVAADKLEAIFEPFFTTKEVGRGTGLGLSQVFGFVKQSGGDVDVQSAPGEGATFHIYLPRAASQVPARAPAAAARPSGRTLRVLLVEDNERVGQFATEMLRDMGHQSVWVGDAQRALAELATDAGRFDVVFSDVIMPGMNGVELALAIRARHPDLPVVLTSGYSQVVAEEGAHGFQLLRKPYSVDGLAGILADAVAQPVG